MLDLDVIRKDLKDIKYYYSRKKLFDECYMSTRQIDIMKKVNMYNDVARTAAPKLYDIYISLYIKNHTQASLADELGFTPEYVQMLNKKLLKFIQNNLVNREVVNDTKKRDV